MKQKMEANKLPKNNGLQIPSKTPRPLRNTQNIEIQDN